MEKATREYLAGAISEFRTDTDTRKLFSESISSFFPML